MRIFSFGNGCPLVECYILKRTTRRLICLGGRQGTNVNPFLWRLFQYHQWFAIVQDKTGLIFHGTKFESQLFGFRVVPAILVQDKVIRVALLFWWEGVRERRRRRAVFIEPIVLLRNWSRMMGAHCVKCFMKASNQRFC